MHPQDYRQYADLQRYLFEVVSDRFARQGNLAAFDFFCIVIWKANRAKSKVAQRLLAQGYDSLEAAVGALTQGIASQPTPRDRLFYLIQRWGFRLPMATAILTVLYPLEFTVYDYRVCDVLGEFHHLDRLSVEKQWEGYQAFMQRVHESAPDNFALRDKDRYLWGRSFYEQLVADITCGFSKETES